MKNGTLIKQEKNIMYLALGWGGVIAGVLCYTYNYTTYTYIALAFAIIGFVSHHRGSKK